ncbi:MAG: PA3496 family putative envelope integrity protein [Moraxellaceae bacterium]
MAAGKSEEFDEDGFEDGAAAADSDGDETAKTVVVVAAVKNSPARRREIDELLEARKLQRRLRDYDYDIDDDNK